MRQAEGNVELKYGTLVADVIGEIICGFANTSGGSLIVGYSEKKNKTFGSSSNDERILRRVMRSFENPPQYELYYVEYQGKRLLVVDVMKNNDCLSLYQGIAYTHENNIYFALSGEELKNRVASQSDKYIQELLPKMQENLIELNNKVHEYEIGLAKSDKKALIYCIAGIIGGAVLSNIPKIIDFAEYIFSIISNS